MYKIPQTHVDFWSHKIQRNKERDHENILALKAQGWHTIEIWECQLKPQEREKTLQGLLRTLNYIALQNQGAKMTYDFDVEEERSMAAEEEESENPYRWTTFERRLHLGNKNKIFFILYFARFALPLHR